MSIILTESFGYIADGAHDGDGAFRGRWSTDGEWRIEDLTGGRKRLYCQSVAARTAESQIFPSSLSSMVVGFLLTDKDGARRDAILMYPQDGSDILVTIGIKDGEIVVTRGNDEADTLILGSASQVPAGGSTYVEVEITFHDTTGSVNIYLNGSLDASVENTDTIWQGTSCDRIKLRGSYADWGFSDLYVDDSDQLGHIKIAYEEMDAAGTNSDWTPSAGSNHENVDEVGPDGDTTYNSSGTTTDKDSLTHDGGNDFDAVLAVEVLARARKEDASDGSLKLGVLHDASESQGDAHTLSTDYTYYSDIFEVNPSTSLAWTPAELEATEMSYENAS